MIYYKAEVETGKTDEWNTNGLLFETEAEADAYARDLAFRWTLVTDWRIREATPEELERDAIYRLEDGRFVRVESVAT